MNTLLVGYDLNRPGQDYAELTKFLKSQPNWWHHLDSTWIVVTPKSTAELRDEIKQFIDADDEVLVMNVQGDGWSSFGFPEKANSWLKQHV